MPFLVQPAQTFHQQLHSILVYLSGYGKSFGGLELELSFLASKELVKCLLSDQVIE